MKNKILKTLLMVVITGVMVLSTTACGHSLGSGNDDDYDFTETNQTIEYEFWAHNWNKYTGANDRIIQFIEDKFNVKIMLTGAPESQWKTKINLLVTNNTAPDLFFYTPNSEVYRGWVSDQLIMPLDPYIEEAGAENLKAMLNSNQLNGSAFDGKHYFVPNVSARSTMRFTCAKTGWINGYRREGCRLHSQKRWINLRIC